jgi:UDP-N-acetylmuramyl pentapeptide phosphotransferase/UDP-N-acetylglucosamine-1-phosphate transferase
LPEWISILLSLFTILVIINAFNLLDGIDGFVRGILMRITQIVQNDRPNLICASALLGSLMAFKI